MKPDIHPDYMECKVSCTCGNSFVTRATKPELRVDICNACHPFFTGTQKLVDSGGRVQRFNTRFGSARQNMLEREAARKAADKEATEQREAAKKAEREAKAAAKAKRAEEFAARAAKAEKEAKKVEEAPSDAGSNVSEDNLETKESNDGENKTADGVKQTDESSPAAEAKSSDSSEKQEASNSSDSPDNKDNKTE